MNKARKKEEMKAIRLVVGAVTFLAMMTVSPPARAAEDNGAFCSAVWHNSFSPGVTMVPQRGTLTTNGETGTINCVGTINGYEVTGPGTFGQDAIFEGTCGILTGASTLSMTIPTDGGSAHVSARATWTASLGSGLKFSDSFIGPLTFVGVPTEGNCITAGVTGLDVVGWFLIKGESAQLAGQTMCDLDLVVIKVNCGTRR